MTLDPADYADPFSLIYDAIWDMLESWAGFTGLVSIGNRIKFSGESRDPVKKIVEAADLPELRVAWTGFDTRMQITSDSTLIGLDYEFQLATGDKRFSEYVAPVAWQILCAETTWATYLRALTWQSHPLVYLAEPKPARLAVSVAGNDLPGATNIVGWAALMPYQVQMYRATALMQTP